jgi:uncharacterized protein (TIGR04255 family)
MPLQQQILQANLSSAVGGDAAGLSLAPAERVVFANKDNLSRLSVGPQIIGVHRARPYIGFEEDMLPRINDGIPMSLEELQIKPSFSSVAVRYINKIDIAATEFDLTDYFNYVDTTQALPRGFDGTVTGFFYRTAAQQRSNPLSLTLSFGSVVAPKDSAAFVLDIDLTYSFEEPVSMTEAIAKTVEVKDTENSIFESLITDRTRGLFE